MPYKNPADKAAQRLRDNERYLARAANPDDPIHGTMTGYVGGKCRCAACKEANSINRIEYKRRHPGRLEAKEKNWRAKTLLEMNADPKHKFHGTRTGYSAVGCRCHLCREGRYVFEHESEKGYSGHRKILYASEKFDPEGG